jgi:putative membrane protein
MKEKEEEGQKRVLVLCVDRDGDLESKAGVKTPLIGRGENLDAAVALALRDPEEPDANAMFEAVRVYDRLKAENNPAETFEIATLSGSELGGVGADRKIVAGLSELLKSFSASEVILVTDGYSDEAVLPLIQSRVPVSSVRRIVVKHSESIEETAALFFRYVKMVMNNPRYSRVVLGLPGLLILILAVFSFAGLVQYYLIAFVFVLSGLLLIKGFGIDKAARDLFVWVKEYSPPPLRVQISNYSLVAGALCVVLGAYLGWTTAASNVPAASLAEWVANLPAIIGFFIQGAVTLMVVGFSVPLLGRAIRWYIEHDARLLRNAVLIVMIGWSQQILIATSELLIAPEAAAGYNRVIFSIVVSILLGVASVLTVFAVHRAKRAFFGETEEQIEEYGGG